MLRQVTQIGIVTCYLGEDQYEGNDNQIGFPVGVYAQIVVAALRAWGQLLVEGMLVGV